MSTHKSYFNKNNTILHESMVNTAKNPVTEIFYGGGFYEKDCVFTGLTGDTCNTKAGVTLTGYTRQTVFRNSSRFIFDLDLKDLKAKVADGRITLTGTGGGHDGSSAAFAGSYTVNSEGGINGVTITAGGTSYTSAPTIVISNAGDGDAVITAEIDGSAAVANEPSRVYVSTIPSSNTTGGQVPYGRSLYNNINLLLGKDIDLMGKIIKDIGSLSSLVDLVKTARNKYEIFSGRDKEYS